MCIQQWCCPFSICSDYNYYFISNFVDGPPSGQFLRTMVLAEDRPSHPSESLQGSAPGPGTQLHAFEAATLQMAAPSPSGPSGCPRRWYDRESWEKGSSRIKGRNGVQACSLRAKTCFSLSLGWSFLGLRCWCGRAGWGASLAACPHPPSLQRETRSLWPLTFFCYLFHIWFLCLLPRLIL